jgi:hypothetical protein
MTDNAPAGATPVVPGATPGQTPPPTPDPPPATGELEIGDAGKRALDVMKAERNAAVAQSKADKKALEEHLSATQSDSEKAIAQAKKDGAAEVTAKWSAQVRRSEVRAALTGAGINVSVLDLAVNAAEFGTLKVTEDGEVEGLSQAVAAFKTARADLFKTAPVPGTADGGARPGGTPPAKDLESAIAAHYAQPKH